MQKHGNMRCRYQSQLVRVDGKIQEAGQRGGQTAWRRQFEPWTTNAQRNDRHGAAGFECSTLAPLLQQRTSACGRVDDVRQCGDRRCGFVGDISIMASDGGSSAMSPKLLIVTLELRWPLDGAVVEVFGE